MVSYEKLNKSRILVVGDVMLDRYWYGEVVRISPEAPVPIVRITRQDERLGGAANVACNLISLGSQATLMTVLGDDDPAKIARSLLDKNKIDQLIHRFKPL
jgi:rfaE bifunctional protein kinase chain/domain